MTTKRRIERTREILRLASLGISQRQMAESCGCSRNTVQETLIRSQVAKISWPLPEDWDDERLNQALYPERHDRAADVTQSPDSKVLPDFEYVHRELARKGVNLKLLWSDYASACKAADQNYLQYAQFCVRYRKFAQKSKATMHINHKPGEKCSVDWAGTTINFYDRETGEELPAYLFVGVLNCSKYIFAQAFPSQKITHWISAHVQMFNYFQGVPRIIVPGNCKTAVVKASLDDPQLNRSYMEMAEHYHCAIVPARPRKPKDKPAAEKSVDIATTWILAALRDQLFFCLADLNQAIQEKLGIINNKPFQKLSGSRRSAFLGEEAATLQPLPQTPFEMAVWKTATAGFNYHIEVEKSFYSLPFRYIKYKVDIRLTARVVEIFHNGQRICSHPRYYGKPGHYETNPAHMPADHKSYLEWDSQRFRSWARKIGPNTVAVVEAVLASRTIEQQNYRSCFGLLKLADKHSESRLEAACAKAMALETPAYSVIKNILKSGRDLAEPTSSAPVRPMKIHRNVRGNDYYAQQAKEMQERQLQMETLNNKHQGEQIKC